MKVGYARVSRTDQDLARQITALDSAGCDKIYTDKISGSRKSRPELDKMLADLKPGDCVIVAKLDRFGRSISHLCNTLDDFQTRNIGFKSLNDGFDTTTANGRLLLHVLAAMAEFERELIRERTKDALKQARLNGKILGRPRVDFTDKLSNFKKLLDSGIDREDIMKQLSISRGKYYRFWNKCKNENI
jgi:DNA invertase Pin-like site-specific DNA recombinase